MFYFSCKYYILNLDTCFSFLKIERRLTLSAEIKNFKEIIQKYDNIVFFGGAGVSTESGIPDFRSVDGLYHQQYAYPPETILSHTFYKRNTREFYRFYHNKMLFPGAKPNAAHLALAKLEAEGKVRAVITQNIDGLHQAAGSKNVFELHGSVHRNYCERCGKFFNLDYIMAASATLSPVSTDNQTGTTFPDANNAACSQDGIPICDACGGVIKPDVVLYEEGLDDKTLLGAINHIKKAQVLIIGGTSLSVYPAAGLVDYFSGDKLIVINKTPTPRDSHADLVIQSPIGVVFEKIM